MHNNLIAVRLTDAQSMTAFRLGGGNTSEGIRRALDAHRGRDIPVRLRRAPARLSGGSGDLAAPGRGQRRRASRTADTTAQAADSPKPLPLVD